MILSNPVKTFLLALVFLTACAGCRFWQTAENANISPADGGFAEDRSDLPFATREPDVYQAEMVVMAGSAERSTSVARNGDKRRIGFASGLVWLKAERTYLLAPEKKIYAEEASADGSQPSAWVESLTVEWLNVKPGTVFESRGTENGLKIYSAAASNSEAAEVLISIDASGMPVKQEYFSVVGEQRDLLYTVEMRNLKIEAPEGLFAVPNDFKKVSMDEFRKATRK